MQDHGECMLVLIDATPEGRKELIGFLGVRESAQSWRELCRGEKPRAYDRPGNPSATVRSASDRRLANVYRGYISSGRTCKPE
jgi:hypothetical protein